MIRSPVVTATAMTVASLLAACGGGHVEGRLDGTSPAARSAAKTTPSGSMRSPPVRPRVRFLRPRTLGGLRLEGVYAVAEGPSFFSVYFRLNRPLPRGYRDAASTELVPVGRPQLDEVDGTAQPGEPIGRFQTRGTACYLQDQLEGSINAALGDSVQFVLSPTSATPSRSTTLRANVRLTTPLTPDFYISTAPDELPFQDVDGAYARALGCHPDAPGEVSDDEYCRLLAAHSPRLGPSPARNKTAVCP
jgi:hypothetical protein